MTRLTRLEKAHEITGLDTDVIKEYLCPNTLRDFEYINDKECSETDGCINCWTKEYKEG